MKRWKNSFWKNVVFFFNTRNSIFFHEIWERFVTHACICIYHVKIKWVKVTSHTWMYLMNVKWCILFLICCHLKHANIPMFSYHMDVTWCLHVTWIFSLLQVSSYILVRRDCFIGSVKNFKRKPWYMTFLHYCPLNIPQPSPLSSLLFPLWKWLFDITNGM